MSGFTRRSFIKKAAFGFAGFEMLRPGISAVSPGPVFGRSPIRRAHPYTDQNAVSLAIWSLNRSYRAGIWNLLDVARICREDFDIDGIEYVTIFFDDVRQVRLRELNGRADDYGVQNVLIMVDLEGDMVSPDRSERMQAAVNHRKWVDVAAYLGCFAIRCNATGGGPSPEADPDALQRAAESFRALIEYADEAGIDVIVENHGGGLAANARWLVDLVHEIDHPRFGLLPDYGNFGTDEPYDSIRLTMPYARGVSVKGGWTSDGEHARYSLDDCLRISMESGYVGYWGIESGIRRSENVDTTLSPLQIKNEEWNAVRWTKKAIEEIVLV